MNKTTAYVAFIILITGASAASADQAWPVEPLVSPPEAVFEAAQSVTVDTEEGEVLILLEEVDETYAPGGRRTRTRTLVYQLLTEAGVDNWDTVSSSWSPWHQERPLIEARILWPEGDTFTLDADTVSEAPSDSGADDVFDDGRYFEAPLPNLKVGSIVETRVTVVETQPRFPGGATGTFYPCWSFPAHHSRLVVTVPSDAEFTWKAWLLDEVTPDITRNDATTRYVFDFPEPGEDDDPEPNLPFDEPRFKSVTYSTGSQWSEIASEYARIVDEQIANSSDLDPPLDAAAAKGDTLDLVQRLLVELHDRVRYTGLEFGRSSIVPYTPEVTLSRGYGDCKDQATLLVAWLRALEIEARVALLSTGFGFDTDPDIIGLGNFNHAIVWIPGEPGVWVDPTSTYHRAGDLPTPDTGRWALIADQKTTGLVKTPEPQSGDHGWVEERVFTMAPEGKSALAVTVEPKGSWEATYRSWAARTTDSERRETVEGWIANRFLAEEVDELTVTPPDDFGMPFALHYTIDEAGRGITAIDEALVAIRYEDLVSSLPDALTEAPDDDAEDEDESRNNDFVFASPVSVTWNYRVTPPLGFVVAHLPEDQQTDLGTASLTETFTVADDGTIEATVALDTGPRRISPEQFEATRSAVEELADRDYTSLYFVHHGMSLLEEGRISEGLAELTRLSELEPENALHQVRLADGLISVGLGEPARRAARRAVENDPDNLAAHKQLGWILQHDLVGRLHGPGFDREGAIEAYRTALELEDADLNLYLNLAILLEHDDHGQRFSADADLDEAIDVLVAARDRFPDEFDHDEYLLGPMFWDRRYEQICEQFPKLESNQEGNRIIATSLAITEGLEPTVEMVRREYRDSGAVGQMLFRLAQGLAQARRYDLAAETYRMAARGSSQATDLLAYAIQMGRTHRIEDLEIDPDTPVGFAQHAHVVAAEPDGEQRLRSEILSQRIAPHIDEEAFSDSAFNLTDAIRASARETGLRPIILTELYFGNIEWVVEGSASPVRRVHMRTVSGDSQGDTVLFLVEEDDSWALIGADYDLSGLGLVALELAEDGDLDGATEILDWARDLLPTYDSRDPLEGMPFSRIWMGDGSLDPTLIRVAALCLAASQWLGEVVQDDIVEMIPTVDDPALRSALEQALLGIAIDFEQTDRILEVAGSLAERYPDSWIPVMAATAGHILADTHAKGVAVATEYLERHPDNIDIQRMLSSAHHTSGNIDRAMEILQGVLNSSEALGVDFNNMAWLALFDPPVDEQALIWANTAVKRGGGGMNGDSASLHTLAAIYAAMEMPSEAYQVMVKAMDPGEPPATHDWWVFGRIAETYGQHETARSAYERVLEEEDEDEDDDASSTAALARLRLHAMDEAEAGQDG